MCGIVGAVSLDGGDDQTFRDRQSAWLERCDSLLFHRGPDSGGTLIEGRTALGAWRLKIHDLSSAADQPFQTSDGKIALVFNGAIFNYRQLRDELTAKGHRFTTTGDTEVVAAGYLEWGEDVFTRLDGMFGIAVLDRQNAKLVVARDKLGIKPLYFHRGPRLLAFSSEIKPLLAHPDIQKAVNRDVISEFLAFQFVMPPDTFFRDIAVLRPGHILSADLTGGKSVAQRAYWQIDSSVVDHSDALDFEDALTLSLKRCWDADRTAGVQLSGGVDSSLACILSGRNLDIHDYPTYSVLFDDSTAKYYLPRSEEKYIKRIAELCSLKNHNWTFSADKVRPALAEAIWYHEQPLYGPSSALYMLLSREVKETATVLITGEGADDIFLGYFPDWNFTLTPEGLFKFFIQRESLEPLVGAAGIEEALAKRWDLLSQPRLQGMSVRQKASVATIETVLHGLLARHDRMFMSNSIEGRPPFCTDHLIRSRFAMPDDEVHDGRHGKADMKRMLASFTDREFAYRKKIGFSAPFGDWCSDPQWWRGYVDKLDFDLLSEFMDVDLLRSKLAMPEGQEKWSGQNLNLIFSITQIQTWHDIFFGSVSEGSPDAWQANAPAAPV